jgi:hypothetical protein
MAPRASETTLFRPLTRLHELWFEGQTALSCREVRPLIRGYFGRALIGLTVMLLASFVRKIGSATRLGFCRSDLACLAGCCC